MIDELNEHYNKYKGSRVTLNNIKQLTPAQADRVKVYGSAAEQLLNNKDFAMFIHHFKFEVGEDIGNITGFLEQDNGKRVALSQHLSAIDSFVKMLQRAVYMKNTVVKHQEVPTDERI